MINLQQAITDKIVIQPLLSVVNRQRNDKLIKLKDNIAAYKRYAADYEKSAVEYVNRWKDAEKQLKTTADESWSERDLVKSINRLKKHKYVDWAFLTKDLELVVQTKMLKQYDGLLEKDTDEQIGRYAFLIQLPSQYTGLSVRVHPLDFSTSISDYGTRYRHPVIYSLYSPCFGDYRITTHFPSGDFYQGVDDLIHFFSAMPDTSPGRYYPVYWYLWLNNRKLDFQPNPWAGKSRAYSIGRVTKAKPLDIPITRRDEVEIEGKQVTLKGVKLTKLIR